MAGEPLSVGDTICIFSEERHGFVFSVQSSSIHSELAIKPKQEREKANVPDQQVVSFLICVANRYKLDKKYRKLKAKSDASPDDLSLKNAASQAKIGSDAEKEDNNAEQARQRGKKVLYGQIIQMQHVFTDKYIHVSTTQTSSTESSNMQVELREYNAKQAQFRIMPRYKVKAEGDIVQDGDQIVLESVKSQGQYLHVSKAVFPNHSVYATCHELNLSVQQSGFTIYQRYKPLKEHENNLKAGDPVRFFHKEIEAYLVAEGLFDDQVTEDVHLRVRNMDQNNPKTLFPSSSAITYWQVELEEGILNGGVVRWEAQCRIRHMSTRKLLMVTSDLKLSLTDEVQDPKTVFRLHAVIKEKDEAEFETYCRMEHVVTGTWLHALNDEYQRKSGGSKDSDMSMTGLKWTIAPLKKVTVSKEQQYDDAFTIQKVEPSLVDIFNYMAGMVPFIQKFIRDKKGGANLNAKQTYDVVSALKEMKAFMILNSVPCKDRQKLLRNLRIVELLVQLLQIPYRGSPDQQYLKKVFVEGYDVLYTYLMGDSRKNELYIAKHLDFFESQISYEGDIGLNAAHMVMELIKDNRKIVDRITKEHINQYVDLLRKKKNYRYLDLLSVLCVCDGVSIPDNQKYITEVWLMEGKKNCVYLTELGQKIGKDSNVVYVSMDNQHTWTALHTFVEQRNQQIDEEFLFLDHQLDLFGKLCYGRNEFAIKVITEELCYLTWEEAFLCLTNEQLPDTLRAKYCHLIIALFVDVGENTSMLDNLKLTFVYDDIMSGDAAQSQPKSADTMKHFPQLRDWISKFLDTNKDMTASLIGHNMLVEQVLRLVHYLVKYGFYGKLQDITQLLGPLLSLLDGRNDKPYPHQQSNPTMNDVLEHYRKFQRYKESPETKAIVDAKYQAMAVLDLFFNFRFNTRLERFVYEFKTTHLKAQTLDGVIPELGPLLLESFDLEDNSGTNSLAVKCLGDMFTESSYFKTFPLVEILLDLSNYEYDKMITQSMALINRYYSAHDNLFKRAVQAQVLITKRSCQVLTELTEILPVMRRYATAKMNDEQTQTMCNILEKMISFCHLENEPEETHPMNQSILYNHGILADVFDILSQEIDIRLLDQYRGLRSTFQKCFKLLKNLTRRNAVVQHRLFDRLDFLLTIQGAEPEMAEALIEVFTGNKDTCMKILPHQVQRIMNLAAQHGSSAPQFLDLLNAIVKVEELNLPLKRNQGYVMKYFMQCRAEVAHIIDQPSEARMKLLTGADCPDLQYFIALVDLLATCAEGENRFIESICQTIFSVDELIEVINNKNIDNNLKRPYLRFLLWVYLNTAGGMIESGSGDMPHDSRVWQYITNLSDELTVLRDYTADNPDVVKMLLKKPPGKSSASDIPLDDPEKLNTFLSYQGEEGWEKHHGTLHYLFEAVMPFLQVFFRSYYQPDQENFPQEGDHVDKLAGTLVRFTEVIGPLINNPTHMKTMVASMSAILSASTLPVQVMEEFQARYGAGVSSGGAQDIRSDARKKYDEYYNGEEELNDQLNIFATNFSVAYGGFNTVKTQIGYPCEKPYTELGGDEELPLGKEFQDHIKCFISEDKKGGEKYAITEKLVAQLSISASQTQMNEKERLEQEVLDIKCLQLLRGLQHNEIVKLPDDWEGDVKNNRRQLKQIEEAQDALDNHGAMLKVLPHLAKTGDDIVREVLAFLGAMLFGGNENVQQSLINYFLGTREEKFFFAFKNRMQLSALATKERRSLMAQHQSKLEEALEQAKALKKAMKSGKLAAEEIMAANNLGSQLIDVKLSRLSMGGKKGKSSQLLKSRYGKGGGSRPGSRMSLMGSSRGIQGSTLGVPGTESKKGIEMGKLTKKENQVAPVPTVQIQDVDDAELEELVQASLDEDAMEYRDEGYIELVLKILGLMCDGQNKILQDYLREQPDNIKAVNLVGESARFLSLVYSNINNHTVGLVTQLFQTLVEFASGNSQNQTVLFDNKICDYINYILRGSQFKGCDLKEILTLKLAIATLIKAMIEENPRMEMDVKNVGVAKEVVESLDQESIYQVMLDCYVKSMQLQGKHKKLEGIHLAKLLERESTFDIKEFVVEVGFQYYHLLCRFKDLREDEIVSREALVKTDIGAAAWDIFAASTLSIEVLKDDSLQKIYFRAKDKSVLREDVKEKFKYDVDRTSPSNKLRDFMVWARDIIEDIKYTRKVMANPISHFFVRFWLPFNMLMIFTSIMINILIIIVWKEPVDASGNSDPNSAVPRYLFAQMNIVIYVLGGIHNLLSLCVLISYFISNHPTLPRLSRLIRFFKRRKRSSDTEEDGGRRNKGSNLEVKFFSFKTFWYLALFATSVLGTAFYGYFFSFHLLHIAEFNQLLKRAIRAVTKNGKSLLWVAVLILIVLYIYGLISFGFLRELYDSSAGLYCRTMYECMVTVITRGLIIGAHEYLTAPANKAFDYHIGKAAFDISFFIIINTILLSIVFGIIVDTFSELRDNKWNVDNDMRSNCFICSRDSHDFESHGGGFENHIKKEHYIWAYLFFFIYLDETRPNDYTAVELYVSRLLEKEKMEFFPLNRALSLQHEEDSNEIRLEHLMSQVEFLVNRMKEEDAMKQREQEKKRQLEWEVQYKKSSASK